MLNLQTIQTKAKILQTQNLSYTVRQQVRLLTVIKKNLEALGSNVVYVKKCFISRVTCVTGVVAPLVSQQ